MDPNAVRTAQSYMNHKGGYTTNQRFDGLGGSLRQMFGAKNDSNGQRDWEKSANEMQGAIRSYTNEIKRLTRVYNIITNHKPRVGATSVRQRLLRQGLSTHSGRRTTALTEARLPTRTVQSVRV